MMFTNTGLQRLIIPDSLAGRSSSPLVIATARDFKHSAHQGSAERAPMLLDEAVPQFDSLAKKAAAFFNSSRSSFSRAFSRRSCFNSSYRCLSSTALLESLVCLPWNLSIQVCSVLTLAPNSRADPRLPSYRKCNIPSPLAPLITVLATYTYPLAN